MKKKILILLGAVLVSTSMTYAQKEKVYVINNQRSRFFSTPPEERIEVEHMNVIKFDLLNQLRGELKFSYEHVIGDKSSLEITAGPNVSNLFGARFNIQGGNIESQLGFSGELGYKYYPLRELSALNQFYIMPAIGVKHFNTRYLGDAFVAPNIEPYQGYKNRLYYTFNVGYQHWVSKTFSVDYFIGMGIANVTEDFASVVWDYDQNTGESISTWTQQKYTFPAVQINAGIRFGIGWSSL